MVEASPAPKSTLRHRILAFVIGLVVLSLLGSVVSLYRITEVNQVLGRINRGAVPLSKLVTQMGSDAEILQRELERGLGASHWGDPRWKPRPVPRWIEDVLQSELERMQKSLESGLPDLDEDSRARWTTWSRQVGEGLTLLRSEAQKLYVALSQKDETLAAQVYPQWESALQEWRRQLAWGVTESDRSLRGEFATAQSRVSSLRTALEVILFVVMALSLLLLWLGERALRPLAELTRLAQEITRRGLRKEDKSLLPEVVLGRSDEVSGLALEFHRMATALLEREKLLESQSRRMEDQNRLLRDIGQLNEDILQSIRSVLVVTNLEGVITQCNPVAEQFLGKPSTQILGTKVSDWESLSALPSAGKIAHLEIQGRSFAGEWMPLKDGELRPLGSILVLSDVTEERNLERRLKESEHMAGIGRMSAQVAHEVRNPLHSIGLEAEMALELAGKGQAGQAPLKQSLQSILGAVERLEKITDNYLKLSKPSASAERHLVDVGAVLEEVLATYAPQCEEKRVRVDWQRLPERVIHVSANRSLLEQVLGNLMRNALQALDEREGAREIRWSMGEAESGRVWIQIEDNGRGVTSEAREKLFTPFFTTRAQGTGLGLSFSKQVIEELGGEIAFEPGTGGVGARFRVLLPSLDGVRATRRQDVTHV